MPGIVSALSAAPSWDLLDDLRQLTAYPFMRSAFLAGTAAAVVAGVVGYFVVLRGLSFAGHSLSQMGFAGATAGLALGVNPLYGLLVVNGAGALLIGLLTRRTRGRDVAVGVVLTGSLGLGLLFLALSSAQTAVPVLVGDILGISSGEVVVTEVAAVVILGLVALTYRPLLFSSLDEDVAEARGVPTAAMSLVLLLLLAATTSIATPVVGVLLTFSLLIAPAATAALLTRRPPATLALSVALGVADIWIGLAIAYWVDVPPSVIVTGLAFALYLAARVLASGGSTPASPSSLLAAARRRGRQDQAVLAAAEQALQRPMRSSR